MSEPLIIIPTYLAQREDHAVVSRLLLSIKETEPDVDVLVVDDHSPDEAALKLLEHDLKLVGYELIKKTDNDGFSKTVNVGLRVAAAEQRDAVLVNADMTFPDHGWIGKLQGQTRADGATPADLVGGLLLYPTGLIQHAGIFFSMLHRVFDHRYRYAPGDLPEAQQALDVPVTGALQYIRHHVLDELGIYDEGFQMGLEDVDYCLRVFRDGDGMECVYCPQARAYHFESMFRGRPSRKVEQWQVNSWAYFMSKWGSTNFARYLPEL